MGNRKICVLQDPFADQNPLINDMTPEIQKLTLHVTAARDEVHIREINVF